MRTTSNKNKKKCFHCERKLHFENECWKLHFELIFDWFKKNKKKNKKNDESNIDTSTNKTKYATYFVTFWFDFRKNVWNSKFHDEIKTKIQLRNEQKRVECIVWKCNYFTTKWFVWKYEHSWIVEMIKILLNDLNN